MDFERGFWFELGKCMWRKHRSVYQDHLRYVRNDTVKSFHVRILRYAERVREMHYSENYSPPPAMKSEGYELDHWKVCDQ